MNMIMALNEDKKGNIWVGNYSGGTSMFDGINWQNMIS